MAYSGNSFQSNRTQAGDTYAEIPQNRTMIAERLTQEPLHIPEVVHGLETVEQIFEHYRPAIELMFDTPEGGVMKESVSFNCIEDFGMRRIEERSIYLKQSLKQREQYLKMMKHLNSNTALQTLIADPGAKQAFLEAISCLRAELKHHK